MDSTIGAALSGLLGTIIALAVVLGLAWVSLRALRRWQDRGLGGRDGVVERQIRFVRALPVGQRERLVLIEAEGELMLVGVTPGSISLLRNWGSGAPRTETEIPLTETIQ
ncbi:FliO/MopB family protein [Sphingomonas psychrotolerans]|uniref:Flagellar biosynthetic protein FliO n=1 Tax=Sphingomonas psychrotolerans TaxID=1327635 RepID=A0A2K8ML03_9SPHN|nr:flagellar biosynthetic protein FliO [Sphingomonas psychrotolerans]ATY31871.1 flagellar biosynthetic protein FliO [Sphingomonas psychrotolerans]